MSLLAVPNFSEGRDSARIEALRQAMAAEATVLDVHSDRVHNRSVYTLAGDVGHVGQALLRGAEFAEREIDMREHEGAHPCVGALDVCPLVWLTDEDNPGAIAAAWLVADVAGGELEIPVFFYGELASSEERRERAYFRRGGLRELERRMEEGELEPDRGPGRPHPTAGATLVSVRPPLVAFNMELGGGTIEAAREIAAELRESGGGPPGVRAIAVALDIDRPQISTNVHDPVAVPLVEVIAATDRLARHRGAWVRVTEIVGLAPAAAMEGFPDGLLPRGYDPDLQLIERRLAALD